jgi:poly-gamma-glutamate capsule biosynthesis protein CapA/YwtB (metallophosphatase superfamily)
VAPYSDTASLLDLPAARVLIEHADALADIVVVAIHAGAEGTDAEHVTGSEESYVGEDRGDPEAFAHMAVDAGADLVLGSGPHVLRGWSSTAA